MTTSHAEGQRAERKAVPYTQIHGWLRRTLETVQDALMILLMVLLVAITLQTLWRLARMTFVRQATPPMLISEIVYVLILTELYRTLIYYLREHRISVILMLEVAIVTVLQHVIFITAQHVEWLQIVGSSVLLLALGTLLAIERWSARMRNDTTEASAH